MAEAVFGLIGTAIGGVITFFSAQAAGRHQLAQKKVELAEQARLAGEAAKRETVQGQRTRHGEFIAAFRREEGRAAELIQLIKGSSPEWSDRWQKKVTDPSHQTSVGALNAGLAWIELTCPTADGVRSVRQLSDTFDAFAFCLAGQAARKRRNEAVDIKELEDAWAKVRREFELVCDNLRAEVRQST